jgi:membrane dipeptidase/D-alanyl-D-alanine dipeptidase
MKISIQQMTTGIFLIAGFLAIPVFSQTSIAEISMRKRAIEIHEAVMTLDTHVDIDVDDFVADKNYTQDLDTQVNLPKMEKGGLDVSWFIVYTGQGELSESGYAAAMDNALAKFEAIHRLTEELAPDRIQLALNSEEARRIHASGKKVAMIGVENAYPIGTDLSNIQRFYDKGARYMSLSHNGHSQFCDSNTGEAENEWLHGGLSELGKKAVAEMNRVGIMIDLSHPSKESNRQMIELSKAPVIASHSSARALSDVSRNLDDELLKMIQKNGGVVQTVAFHQYVDAVKSNANDEASQSLYRQIAQELGIEYLPMKDIGKLEGEELSRAYENYDKIMKISQARKSDINAAHPPVDVKDFVNHIDYMVDLIGIDHVGISSDFDGGGGVLGWKDASETFNVTLELVRRGYSEEEIAKLWGGNLLRVLDEVQAVAKKLQSK